MKNQIFSSKVTPMFARKTQTQNLANSHVVHLMMRPNPNFGCTTRVMHKIYNKHNWLTVIRSSKLEQMAA